MHFTKMEGLGNDYLYVYGEPENAAALSRRLSDRHFGAGSDGMIWIGKSDKADFSMRIFNADGSEAKMCGNGIRCVGKYVYDKGYTKKTDITIETLSGIKSLHLFAEGGTVTSVTVDMGKVTVFPETVLSVDGKEIHGYRVDVGNPHFVTFDEGLSPETVGAKIEKHEMFDGGINAEFVRAEDKTHLRMRVWERGSGITMACGTGACASVAAAVYCGLCPENETVFVRLDGGVLSVKIKDGKAYMTGPAVTVYEGEVKI